MQQQQLTEQVDPDFRKALDNLSSKNEQTRSEAEQKFEEMGPEAFGKLLATLAQEGQKRRRTRNWIIGSVVGYMVLILTITIIFPKSHAISSIGSMTSMLAVAAAASTAQKTAAKQLAKYNDKRAVGPLAEALEYQDKQVIEAAAERLVTLLPTLQATDTHLLNDAQRKCLHRALFLAANRKKNLPLGEAILTSLQQVGDQRDLAAVERIATSEDHKIKGSNLQEQAKAVLPFLHERIKAQTARETLLRAADGNQIGGADTLLRPVEGSVINPADPHQLLRAADQEIPLNT